MERLVGEGVSRPRHARPIVRDSSFVPPFLCRQRERLLAEVETRRKEEERRQQEEEAAREVRAVGLVPSGRFRRVV
jgi:hypothetical protein